MGKVEKLIKHNAEDTAATCAKCQGENKDKPVKNLTIIWDMK